MQNVYEFNGIRPRIADGVFIAPNAVVIGDVEIGAGSSVWFGAVIRADYGPVRIGRGTSIQDNAVVHVNHSEDAVNPTIIGDHCTIGHGAVIEGCELADLVVVGMNAVVLPGTRVGPRSIVAAGAVVPGNKIFDGETLLTGVPATAKKDLAGPMASWPRWAAEEYIKLAEQYRGDAFAPVAGRESNEE